ncbi:MAG: thiamine phosphate synthase [Campylobacterales bacterium]|nr:thiamine phosphate synthase [Campylobacterales bacterium]
MSKVLKGLYAITDERLTPLKTIENDVKTALQNGVSIIQYRDKNSDVDVLRATAIALQNICNDYNALFVLNDHIDLAIELGCDGLHIGKSDHEQFESIRKKFGGFIGVSCYGDVALAKSFEEKGADYVAFGSFFSSKTKPSSNIVTLDVLIEAKEKLQIPVCAIGGINAHNIEKIAQTKVDMISCIDAVFNGNIKENVNALIGAME